MSSALKWMPLVAALALAGCARDGYYDDRAADYVEAEPSAPLVLPDGRDTRRYGDAMPVPEAQGTFVSQGEDFRVPPPRALGAGGGVQAGGVALREAAGQRWLVIGAAPSVVWSELEDFVAERGLTVVQRDANRGLLVTDQASLSVRPGLQQGASELRCEQGGATQQRCLRALQRHFEERGATASASSLAVQRPEDQASPLLTQSGGEWHLEVPYAADRTWAELSYQLEADFAVDERRELLEQDAEAGTFLVDYLTLSARSAGIWDTLTSFGGADPQRIRLSLEASGPESTVLKADSADDRELSDEDRRELLERLAGLLG
ncbi:Outer membrane protein assembly factor BamC [Halomonas sp. THAF12]|uniref:outer membrane protein assembly factor BamC n=1 Tax=Halomonas sp. THAF12 TaxID=2587849 RepID=UPI0012A977AE|nr:outer membrane protein assembly factor BamC [Halomonas sp. THAF12]QFT86111.1 Outer membrane protein assembly factor BamC [Halomonas sp. THAF12]